MKKQIEVFDYANDILKAVKTGVLLTTKADDKVNTMTISWGTLGIEWGKTLFTVFVRENRFTKSQLDWSIEQQEHPVMILMPGNGVINDGREAEKDYSNIINKFKVEEEGSKVAILGLGDFYQIGEEASKMVEDKLGFKPTLINPRFASGVDKELLEDLKQNHELVITLEDGILRGGFGESIASFYGDSDMKVKNYGLEKEFYDRYNPNQLLDELGITPEKIVNYIEGMIK